MKRLFIYSLVLLVLFGTCSSDNSIEAKTDVENSDEIDDEPIIRILSLGDSYTIGQSVCNSCRFPAQLKDSLETQLQKDSIALKIIAQTGWTTSNLIQAISTENPEDNYDLVTLLIGVNNQYQNKDFSIYETQFPELLNTAVSLADGKKTNVIVVSIPDYAYTPFGQNTGDPQSISEELDQYNSYAERICSENNIVFINITDITRMGLEDTTLVASDGLHPSEEAYTEFVNRILPIAITILD